MNRKTAPLRQRFERAIHHEPNTGCHLWGGGTVKSGYGSVKRGRRSEGCVTAHRAAWEIYVGPIPSDLYVLHRCDVPCCVNPDHLFLGTAADNAADRAAKGRGARGRLPYGVRRKPSGRYAAVIKFGGKDRHFGTYDEIGAAAAVALDARHWRGEAKRGDT